jgi:hypothetical protein
MLRLTYKYLICSNGVILFGEHITHSQVASGDDIYIFSAGFVILEWKCSKIVKCMPHGESASLAIKSHPIPDEFLIRDFFDPMSKVKYHLITINDLY